MGISVGDLLSMDFFKDFHVIAGHKGLNREIQGVSFLEVPEGHRWSIGKELIFTSGYIFAEFEGYLDKFCENFIPSHAALVIKRGSYLDKIPEKLIEIYDRNSIPLITMPYSPSWMTVVNQVNVGVLNHAIQSLRIDISQGPGCYNQNYKEQAIQKILKTLEKDTATNYQEGLKKLYEKITKGFGKSQLKLKEIYFYENPEKGKQIYLYLKKKKGREISTRQAAVLLSSMTMEKMKPLPDQKKMIGNYYEIYGFTPEEKFHVITGIHTSPMIAGDENGDSFSMGKVREGSFVSMISDGMGTGQEAKKESGKVIEVMEELLGAGINESQSIQLLRSMMILQPEKEKYATLDFFQLDLFAGIGTFFKIGACPCLLKRKNNVEIIQVDTMPVNLLLHTEKIPIYRKKMESDDILVMLSDGAFDGFSQNGLEMAAQYLKEMDVVRPQAIADGLYERITTNEAFEKRDDMTIMVLGIWDRY